jgi:RNA polymerase sigma-70 factor (ECF subfamily)
MSKVQKGKAHVDTANALATPTMDREAQLDELVRTQRDKAIAMAYHLVGGDIEAAKDVAQDAFVSAHRALPTFRGDAQLSTWFMRILINKASSYRRWKWLRDRWTELSGDREVGASEEPAGDPGLRKRIAAAMDSLSGPQRAAFAMVHLEGMTVAEAAAVLDRAPGTVKSHLHRALEKLRRELADLESLND